MLKKVIAFTSLLFALSLPYLSEAQFAESFIGVTFGVEKKTDGQSSTKFLVQLWELNCRSQFKCTLQRRQLDCGGGQLDSFYYRNSSEQKDLQVKSYDKRSSILEFTFLEKPLSEEWVNVTLKLTNKNRVVSNIDAVVINSESHFDANYNFAGKRNVVYRFQSAKGMFERKVPCNVSWPGIVPEE